MSSLIEDIVRLTREGWRPYQGEVRHAVYESLSCSHGLLTKRETRTRPYWFSRADIFLCVGCSRKCSLNRPAGFQPALEINYAYDPEKPFPLTPEELVVRKSSLRVDEAAYCLNCSEAKIYKDIYEGKLVTLRDKPIRIRSRDIAEKMNDWDE